MKVEPILLVWVGNCWTQVGGGQIYTRVYARVTVTQMLIISILRSRRAI